MSTLRPAKNERGDHLLLTYNLLTSKAQNCKQKALKHQNNLHVNSILKSTMPWFQSSCVTSCPQQKQKHLIKLSLIQSKWKQFLDLLMDTTSHLVLIWHIFNWHIYILKRIAADNFTLPLHWHRGLPGIMVLKNSFVQNKQ